jgi:kynurenine formamidase
VRTKNWATVAGAIGFAVWTTSSISMHAVPPQQVPADRTGHQNPAVNDTRTTKDQFDRWMKELSNWGRWGKDDELGAVNLITPAKRQQGAALVKTGTVVSLAHNLLTDRAVDAQNPFVLRPRISENSPYAFDTEEIDYHGYTFSHLDALCHVSYNGALYNGFRFREVVTQDGGCTKLGVTGVKDRIVTRAVLIDIPRLKGLPYLEPGTHVYREDIEAWERQAGARISPGDVILLRTGRWTRRASIGPFMNVAGFDASVAPFFKNRDVAVIGSDGVQDVGTLPGVSLPIHTFAIVALGANLLDNLDLEAVADTAARLKRWEFLLMAGPTPVTHGSGSPINPLAVF